MNAPEFSHRYALAVLRVPEPASTIYSLDEAARLAGIHPEILRHYCQLGLFGPEQAEASTELVFNDDAIYELLRFERYRRNRGINRKTLRLICGLWREIDRLQAEVRFLRNR